MSTQAPETAENQASGRQRTLDNLEQAMSVIDAAMGQLGALTLPKRTKETLIATIEAAKETVTRARNATRRVLGVLKAGYPKIDEPKEPGWAQGFLEEDPRPYPHTPRWIWPATGIAGLLVLAGWLAVVFLLIFDGPKALLEQQEEWEDVAKMIGLIVAVPMLITFGVIKPWLGKPHNKRNREALEAAELPTDAKRFFRPELPSEARTAWETAQASGHFSTIRVAAPREAFQRPGSVPFLIFGTSGQSDRFLIHRFDPQAQEAATAPSS